MAGFSNSLDQRKLWQAAQMGARTLYRGEEEIPEQPQISPDSAVF
jgi:hypothetical protein